MKRFLLLFLTLFFSSLTFSNEFKVNVFSIYTKDGLAIEVNNFDESKSSSVIFDQMLFQAAINNAIKHYQIDNIYISSENPWTKGSVAVLEVEGEVIQFHILEATQIFINFNGPEGSVHYDNLSLDEYIPDRGWILNDGDSIRKLLTDRKFVKDQNLEEEKIFVFSPKLFLRIKQVNSLFNEFSSVIMRGNCGGSRGCDGPN